MTEATAGERVQLHVELPYKIEVRRHPQVQNYLERGWLVVDVQRVTDRDALVTLAPPATG